jgi:hypothetical protein
MVSILSWFIGHVFLHYFRGGVGILGEAIAEQAIKDLDEGRSG